MSLNNSATLAKKIYDQARTLPEESLLDLASYIEFLRFKAHRSATRAKSPRSRPLRIVKLGGILKGYDFSPELLAAARREMWKKFYDPKS